MNRGLHSRNAILRSALADLRHEWPLSLCVVLSIAALLLPIGVLYGLKHGVVSILENRLRNDPRTLELRPAASGFFPASWIDARRREEGIAFAIGLPRSISATVRVRTRAGSDWIDASILPSGIDDPYLAEATGGTITGAGDCAVSASLARESGLGPGDSLEFQVARSGSGGGKPVSAILKVRAVLPEYVLDYPALLALPEVANAVEEYLDGFEAARFAWPGEQPFARPAYDGAVVFPRDAISLEELHRRINERLGGSGFTRVETRSPALSARLGLPVDATAPYAYVTNANSLVEPENVERLRSRLESENLSVTPWVLPLSANLQEGGSAAMRPVRVLTASPGEEPTKPLFQKIPAEAQRGWPAIFNGAAPAKLFWNGLAEPLEAPLHPLRAEAPEAGVVFLRSAEAGLLRRSLVRPVRMVDGRMNYARGGYASFRISARSLQDVARVRDRIEAMGIRVLAENARIEEVMYLDRQLGRIFALFATVAGTGAIACLFAIAYSTAERKKRALAFLQILGATRAQAARFPLYQCLVLSGLGGAVAWAGNAVFAAAVNTLFQSKLGAGESLSHLPMEAAATAFAALLAISLLCYLVMIPRFVGMPLGEAAREP